MAVAVNPTDDRYTALIGKLVRLPLSGVDGGPEREIPILADDWAKLEFGTGAVKVTPAHDPNDFAIGQRHGLPNLSILNETAHVALPGSPYDGMDRYAAREKIVDDLRESGLLVEIKDHTLSIGLSQRTGVVIEPRLSQQWFLKIQPLADKAIEAVDKGYIRFTPDQYRKTYDEWMKNIHDWCISRQLWWGHRIPAWHCGKCGEILVARETPSACSKCGSSELTQETDVLDTWFSSGLLPFTVFGWPGKDSQGLTPDLAAFYPTELLVTGFDILFFWVARMIMLGCHFMLDVPMPDGSKRTLKDAVPFREVYIHALVRDADRQKMSKTKGNVIDPIEIVTKYGTDAVRFTLASMASPGTDIAFSESRTEGYRAFANKIWNAARFLFMQVDRARQAGYKMSMLASGAVPELPAETPLETRWIFGRLHAVSGEVERSLADYRFDEAAAAIYQFFWGEFCDWYLELVKLRLEFGEGIENNATTALTLASLVAVFEAALRLLSPFMPFLTEELWHALYEGNAPAKSIALTRYPLPGDFAADDASVAAMTNMQELITTIRALRKELGVPEKEAAPIRLHAENRVLALADANRDMLTKMARVSELEFATETLSGSNARATAAFDVAVIYERQIDVAAERERLTKELSKLEKGLTAAERQLSNDTFTAKAPPHIVEGLKKQAAETKMLYEKAKTALEALPTA
ncbi:valine--tRNA ligase [Edaphobacter sp. HDX4]|uniref:valine--tRNA ligase n=1 Tax=Edaphobacter sp. HDX4 TaxID=2794064 RepID=UPI002FE64D9F